MRHGAAAELAALLLLTACGGAPPETPAFQIETPILLASWDIPPGYLDRAGEHRLLLEYTAAVYDQSAPGGGWTGQTRFRAAGRLDGPEDGVVTEGLFGELRFDGPFPWYGGDCNGDGRPDLALTQWGSASGGDYGALVTLNPGGTVERLPVLGDRRRISDFGLVTLGEETETFLIPYRHTGGSLELTPVEGGFAVDTPLSAHGDADALLFLLDEVPEDLSGRMLRDVYLWREDHFELAEQRLLPIDVKE